MVITSKTRYGLKALLDIVFHDRSGPVQRRHIAARQGIPTDYMDQILMRLRDAGLIQSLRGREGGYHLALEPYEISIWDVVLAVEDAPYLAQRIMKDPESDYASELLTEPAWKEVENTIELSLRNKTLADCLNDAEERIAAAGLDAIVLSESKPGPEFRLGQKIASRVG